MKATEGRSTRDRPLLLPRAKTSRVGREGGNIRIKLSSDPLDESNEFITLLEPPSPLLALPNKADSDRQECLSPISHLEFELSGLLHVTSTAFLGSLAPSPSVCKISVLFASKFGVFFDPLPLLGERHI